jgi:hypothetical protein
MNAPATITASFDHSCICFSLGTPLPVSGRTTLLVHANQLHVHDGADDNATVLQMQHGI